MTRSRKLCGSKNTTVDLHPRTRDESLTCTTVLFVQDLLTYLFVYKILIRLGAKGA